MDTVEKLQEVSILKGWRKIKHIRKTLKSQFRATSKQVFTGKKESLKKQSVKDYLRLAKDLQKACEALLVEGAIGTAPTSKAVTLLLSVDHYTKYVMKFIDQIERRLLNGEVIPATEKIYSIFEPHTEWITKGKLNKKVELGHLLLLTTDQYQFIVDYKIMEGEKDASQIKPLIERLEKKWVDKKISSISFDKGFFSKDNFEALAASKLGHIILPKKGKKTIAEKERESDKTFKKLRNQHSAVESNINMLEHHGLNRCMDKGIKGFKRCVGLSVLSYNLHLLGNALQAAEKKKEEKKQKRKRRQAHKQAV